MKKTLLVFCLLFLTTRIFAQQFSQINTGSLYDSFENPSQKAFITDTSRRYASNFFFPNFNADLFLIGDAQTSLKSRLFLKDYNNAGLKVGQGRYNHATINANAYLFMFKMFSSFKGDQEIGFSWQFRAEGKGLLSNESIAIFDGSQSFNSGVYDNIFNDHYYLQTYHQISFTYKEKIDKQLSFGAKLSALLGTEYQELNIKNSSAYFDKADDIALLSVAGAYYASENTGLSSTTYTPNFNNPGASITVGTTYRTNDNFVLQANIKDLGFIHWNANSNNYLITGTPEQVTGIDPSNPERENNIAGAIKDMVTKNATNFKGSFTTPTDGRVELSAMKSFPLDYDNTFKYSPTLVLSKEFFYTGFVAALVNPFQYKSVAITLTTTYDELKTFTVGSQFAVKRPNWDFFIGSDRLVQSAKLLYDQVGSRVSQGTTYTGANFFIGFSAKFGPVTEHPMNSSTVPLGEEKGFLGRFFDSIFKSKRIL